MSAVTNALHRELPWKWARVGGSYEAKREGIRFEVERWNGAWRCVVRMPANDDYDSTYGGEAPSPSRALERAMESIMRAAPETWRALRQRKPTP